MLKKEYIEFARAFGWTAKDAERAYNQATIRSTPPITEVEILRTLATFAGRELTERQRLQAAQKGQVTRNRKALNNLEEKIIEVTDTYDKKLKEERELWRDLLEKVYEKLRKYGVKLDFIENLLNRNRG